MKKRISKYFILILTTIFILSACGTSKEENNKDVSKTETSNHKGGTLKVGLGHAPSGVYSPILSSDASDSEVVNYFNEGLLKIDKKIKPQPYIASWKDIDPGKKLNLK